MIHVKHSDQCLQCNELSVNVSCGYIVTEIHACITFIAHVLIIIEDITY